MVKGTALLKSHRPQESNGKGEKAQELACIVLIPQIAREVKSQKGSKSVERTSAMEKKINLCREKTVVKGAWR
jgi:hypothetical protein